MKATQERIYDVTLPLREGAATFPGDPPIRLGVHSAIERGDPANVSTLAFGSHTGTHVDAPRHFLRQGETVDHLALSRLVGPAVVLDLSDGQGDIGARELAGQDLGGSSRVLLRTGNGERLRRGEFAADYRALTPEGAGFLLDHGVELVGVDSLSIERFGSEEYPVHHLLLGRGVVIVEGLDLSEVAAGRYRLICLPLRLDGLDGAPARVVLVAL